jgi:hypothetical protein
LASSEAQETIKTVVETQEVQMTVFEMTMCWLDVNALVVLVALKSLPDRNSASPQLTKVERSRPRPCQVTKAIHQ